MRRRDLLLLVPALASGQRGPRPLFDGTTLAGWTVREGPESAFYAADGAIVASPASAYPAWLRSARQYENFDLRLEFHIQGWIDGGVYLHAPEHGRPAQCGLKVNIFHAQDQKPQPNSMGAIFPLVAPRIVNVQKGWNTMRIRMDWPKLQVWANDAQVQDLDLSLHPELRYRRRSGYLGFTAISYPLRLRNIAIEELPSKEQWRVLYGKPADYAENWMVTEDHKNAPVRALTTGPVLWCDGSGCVATKEKFRDFELQMYVRHILQHNSGVFFRSEGKGGGGFRYEIQLHDVEEAHYPTGSLYGIERAKYPRIRAGEWFPFELRVKDRWCQVRINGETVMEHGMLERLDSGHIELQAHAPGKWTEFKDIRIKPL
jgi:hypothetical protein